MRRSDLIPSTEPIESGAPPAPPPRPARGRGVGVLVGLGLGVSSTAVLTLVMLGSTGQLRPTLAGIYSALALGGILVAVMGWFFLQE